MLQLFMLFDECESSPANLMDLSVLLMYCPQIIRMLILLCIMINAFFVVGLMVGILDELTGKKRILNKMYAFIL